MGKLRKIIASLGVIAMLSTLVVTSVASAEWYDGFVEDLVATGVIDTAEGYRPGDKITRAELVVFAVSAFSLEGSTEIDFSDVSADAAYYADLQTAVANGVVKGYDDGTFRPGNPVLRSELVKILVEAGDLPECEVENPFTDIPTGAEGWYKDYAVTAYCNSVVDGINKGDKFGGGMDTARSSAAKMVSVSMAPVLRANATEVVVEEVPGDLEGGAGSITVSEKSTYNNEEVGEGEEEAKVMAFEIEADDSSDVEITSLKVALVQSDEDGSDKMDDYIETVYVLFDGEVVGEADADAFSENSDVYTKFITLDDSIIRMGEEGTFTIAVTSVSNLDSGDIANNEWVVDIQNIRFIDAEGVVTTETLSTELSIVGASDLVKFFEFADFATANNVELEADLTDENPEEGVVIGDDSDETEVLLLSFDYTPDGSDMNIEELSFLVTTEGDDVEVVAQDIIVRWGEEEASESTSESALTETVLFDDLDIDIDEDEVLVFEVYATVNELLEEGQTIKAELVVDDTAATDESDEDVEDLTGSADGEIQHLYTVAPEVTYVSSSIVVVDNGDSPAESATVELVVDVTALGGTVYLNGDDESSGITALYDAAYDEGSDVSADIIAAVELEAAEDEYIGDAQVADLAAAATAVGAGRDLAAVITAMDIETNTFVLYQGFIVDVVGASELSDYEFSTSGDYSITNSGDENEYYKITEGKTMTVTITATITEDAGATVLAGFAIESVRFGTDKTTDITRSIEVMSWSDLIDSLKTSKKTLVGA